MDGRTTPRHLRLRRHIPQCRHIPSSTRQIKKQLARPPPRLPRQLETHQRGGVAVVRAARGFGDETCGRGAGDGAGGDAVGLQGDGGDHGGEGGEGCVGWGHGGEDAVGAATVGGPRAAAVTVAAGVWSPWAGARDPGVPGREAERSGREGEVPSGAGGVEAEREGEGGGVRGECGGQEGEEEGDGSGQMHVGCPAQVRRLEQWRILVEGRSWRQVGFTDLILGEGPEEDGNVWAVESKYHFVVMTWGCLVNTFHDGTL